MKITDIVQSLSTRTSWQVAQKILASIGFPRGMGWDKTLDKIGEVEDVPENIDNITECLIEQYLTGEKLVQFHKVDNDTKTRLQKWLQDAKPAKSVFRDAYPLVTSEQVRAGASFKPTLVDVVALGSGSGAIFASARVVTVREEVTKGNLSDKVAEELGDYDELVGIRHVRLQAMDVIWVPKVGNTVELRADFPKGVHRDTGEAALAQLKKIADAQLGSAEIPAAANLFPLIGGIYGTAGEGCIVELAFGTTTASLKHEKMRRQHMDLREEAYHKGGKRALAGDIEPHRMSVVWKRSIGEKLFSAPELTLHTTARAAAAGGASTCEAEIRNCVGVDDYEFVRSRILQYL